MPHEHIYDSEHHDGSRGVQVSWASGKSLTEPSDFQPGEVRIGSGDITHEGLPIGDQSPTIFFTTLSREGINRLIRTLRRARNAAYGADE